MGRVERTREIAHRRKRRVQLQKLRGRYAAANSESEKAEILELSAGNLNRMAEKHPEIPRILDKFYREPYVYTLEPPPLGDQDPMDRFLFETRRGFCEHYAYAFVLLMRAAGVPARALEELLVGRTQLLALGLRQRRQRKESRQTGSPLQEANCAGSGVARGFVRMPSDTPGPPRFCRRRSSCAARAKASRKGRLSKNQGSRF